MLKCCFFCLIFFAKLEELFLLQISTVAESEDSQESVDSVTDSQKRREILSRRPSYRSVRQLLTNIFMNFLDFLLSCPHFQLFQTLCYISCLLCFHLNQLLLHQVKKWTCKCFWGWVTQTSLWTFPSAGRSSTTYRQTFQQCLELRKRSPRTTQPPPSPPSPCPLPSIRPAAANTVSIIRDYYTGSYMLLRHLGFPAVMWCPCALCATSTSWTESFSNQMLYSGMILKFNQLKQH